MKKNQTTAKREIDDIKIEIAELRAGLTAALSVADQKNRVKNFLIILLLMLLILTNFLWLQYEQSFVTVEENAVLTQTSTAGCNSYIEGGGSVTNGDSNNFN